MVWWLLACGGAKALVGPEPSTVAPTTPPDPDPATGPDTEPTSPADGALRFDGAPPRNLLYVSLDTTRRDFVSRHGDSDNTPRLDRFLEEGVSLDDHRSCSSWTAPSMTCATTGLTQFELDFWSWNEDPRIRNRHPNLPNLARYFRDLDYATVLLTSNPVFGPWTGLGVHFESPELLEWSPATQVTSTALDRAQALVDDESPFYLHVHYIDPHDTYCPPRSYVDEEDYIDDLGVDICGDPEGLFRELESGDDDRREELVHNVRELYDAELEYWDVEFGRLLDGLDAMGALDDTLVVFVTDHGEQLLERGRLGHGLTLEAEENRAVAGFWAKNLEPRAWAEPTVHQDLVATIADVFAIEPAKPLSGYVVGRAPVQRTIRTMLFWGQDALRLGVSRGSKVLLYDWSGAARVRDYAVDPQGLTDAELSDDEARALQSDLEAFIDDIDAQWPVTPPGR